MFKNLRKKKEGMGEKRRMEEKKDHDNENTSQVGSSALKNPPAMQETRVDPWLREDHLEEGMATHSGILAWRIHGQGLHGLQSTGNEELDMNEST